MIVAVGRSAGTCERPEESEPIIDNIEGFGFVSEMMLSARRGLIFFFFGGIGVGLARLVGAGVINVGRLRIAKGGKTTMLKTGWGIASTAILACCAGGAGAMRGRLGKGIQVWKSLSWQCWLFVHSLRYER